MDNSISTSESTLLLKHIGITSKYTITLEHSHILRIEHTPNQFILVCVLLLIALTGWLAYQKSDGMVYSILFLIVFLFELIAQRPIHCVMDKQNRKFHYTRGGILGLPFKRQEVFGSFNDIGHFDMKQHMKRGRDAFQILLWLRGFEKYPLSHNDLSFRECQEATEKIRGFVDPHLPIGALD
jgi:hypothetical protein